MVSNQTPTIIELQACCAMLLKDIEKASLKGDLGSVELHTCEAALVAIQERIHELLASDGQLGS